MQQIRIALNALWSYLVSQDVETFDCQHQLDTVMAQLMNGDCERAGMLRTEFMQRTPFKQWFTL